jgi:hypothetical protein
MVPMMEVLRYSFAGVYSVLSWLSHSILVLPELRWSRLLVVLVGVYRAVYLKAIVSDLLQHALKSEYKSHNPVSQVAEFSCKKIYYTYAFAILVDGG